MNGFFNVPVAKNEPVRDYAPGSEDAKKLKEAIADLRSTVRDIPMYINGEEVRTGNTMDFYPPHDNKTKVAQFHVGTKDHVQQAIDSALAAKDKWENLAWEQRVAIFMKAADLIAGPYRYKLNAATMIGQSKNA